MSLSAKFVQLKKVPTNPSNNNGPRARVQQSAACQQRRLPASEQSGDGAAVGFVELSRRRFPKNTTKSTYFSIFKIGN